MTIDEAEARMAARETPGGLHVTYDDGQNVHVEEMWPCPWCGLREMERDRPYVQVSSVYLMPDARVVCPRCHASTPHVGPSCPTYDRGGRNVTRDIAVEMAVERWNSRRSDE